LILDPTNPAPPPSLADEQSRMNRSTRGQWDWYASHRRQIERLIVPAERGGRICVLGAGNCNDLDLKWLTEVYAEVHLVDIDPAALERATERQGVAGHSRIVLNAPVDLTGVAEVVKTWKGRQVSGAEVDAAVTAVGRDDSAGELFNVVLSPCVLSQMLVGTRDLVGKDHAAWPRLKAAIRARHLRTVARSLRPGGRGVLAIDVTSTSSLPGLDRAADSELNSLMLMCVREGKCFRGLEPAEVAAALSRQGIIGSMNVTPPWLWHLGWGKAFLVYAVMMQRNPDMRR
jgi:hypothetical protein